MNPRVLLLTNRSPVDDLATASPFVHDFCEALVRHHVDLQVITPRYPVERPERDPWVNRFDWAKSDRVLGKLSLWNPGDLRKVLSALFAGRSATTRAVRAMRPDFILALWAMPSGWWAMRAAAHAGVPYGVWCLGSDVQLWGRRIGARALIRKILRRADVLYADGYALSEEASALCGRPCNFLPSLRTIAPPARDPGHPLHGDRYMLNYGRLNREKGVLDLLDAMRKLPDRSTINLVLAGIPDSGLDVAGEIDKRNLDARVRFVGELSPDQLAVYIRHAEAVVIPSRRDSIPLVLGEALQLGTPVLCSDLPDLCELLGQYRVGTVFPVGDSASLARQLNVYRIPPSFSTEAARFLATFSPDAAARRLVADMAGLGVPGAAPQNDKKPEGVSCA